MARYLQIGTTQIINIEFGGKVSLKIWLLITHDYSQNGLLSNNAKLCTLRWLQGKWTEIKTALIIFLALATELE